MNMHALAFVLVVFIVVAPAIVQSASKNRPNLLNMVRMPGAKDSDGDYLLTSISQAVEFAKRIESVPSEWFCWRNRQALDELVRLIQSYDDRQLCSQKKADQVRDFFLEYVLIKAQEKNWRLHPLLKKLFIGFGLRLSQICRRHMIQMLVEDAASLVDDGDLELLSVWTGPNSAMATILSSPDDYEDLRLPKNLARLLRQKQDAESGDSKIHVETGSGNTLRQVQMVCERRFKPIYEKLLLPLVTLSSVGFNYKVNPVDLPAEEFQPINGLVYHWYRIVLLCESLADVEIVENPLIEDQLPADYVRILSPYERQVLQVNLNRHREEAAASGNNNNTDDDDELEIEPLIYRPQYEKRLLGDQLIDVNDPRQMKAIKKFKDYHSKLELIKSKSFRKMVAYVKSGLKKGAVKIAGYLTGAHGLLANEKDYNNYQTVKLLDQFVGRVKEDEFGWQSLSMADQVKILFRLHLIQVIFVSISVGAVVLVSGAVSAMV